MCGCIQTSQSGSATVDLTTTAGPGVWPQLAHDARNTSYAPGAAPPRDEIRIAWKGLGERAVFQPVANRDLYVTGREAVMSFDSTGGSENWTNSALPQMRWATALHDDRMLVITREKGNVVRLHALDTTSGDQLWVREEGITASSGGHPLIGPTVRDGAVYIGSDRGVIKCDAVTGEIDWTATLGPDVVETEDGPTWDTNWATPAVDENRVYTFDLNDAHRRREVYAVDRETGDRDWTAQLELSDEWTLEGYVVAGNETVFVMALEPQVSALSGNSGWSGTQRIYALDAGSGEITWQWEPRGKTLAPPAYAEGILFVGTVHPDTETGRLHAVDATDRSILWTYQTESGGIGSPAVTGGGIYFSQGEELAAVAVQDGSLNWRLSFDNRVSAPILAEDTVYALTGSDESPNHLVAIRQK